MANQGTKHKRSDTNPAPDINDIQARLKDMPPHTLKNYVLEKLSKPGKEPSGDVLDFFAAVEVPTELHCARCHQNFYEDANTDKSCEIEHDDEPEFSYNGDDEAVYLCCGYSVDMVCAFHVCGSDRQYSQQI